MPVDLLQRRASGVLMPLFCLPSAHGIGNLGSKTNTFLDFLEEAGQQYWQMLPVTPSGAGNSPYQSLSAFAGSPLYVDLGALVKLGLLSRRSLRGDQGLSWRRVNYPAVEQFKSRCLREAFDNAENQVGGVEKLEGWHEFCERESGWLNPWTLYMALKREHGLTNWQSWPDHLKHAQPGALDEARERLRPLLKYETFVQYLFQRQWDRLHEQAQKRGISLIGDLPIFVSMDSADTWEKPGLFDFNNVAGVPPDYFSEDGQYWGNPVYFWPAHREENFAWWKARLRRMFSLFDIVRVDHFIGFERTWTIPLGSASARDGHYEPGPGIDFFRSLESDMGKLGIIAEDLGLITPEVEHLRDEAGFPGMKVMQFAFGGGASSGSEQPHNWKKNLVGYTGTHDNNTSVGWFEDGDGQSDKSDPKFRAERDFALEYLHGTRSKVHWDMIRGAWSSPANTVIAPVQDLFGLGSEARVNRPGTAQGNWDWRLSARLLNKRTARQLRELTGVYGRLK